MKKQVSGVGGLASLAKKDWMNTRLRVTLTNHVVGVLKKYMYVECVIDYVKSILCGY